MIPDSSRKASTEYLSKLLTNRDPKDGYQGGFEPLRLLHNLRMSEELENKDKLTYQDFENMLKKMKKKKAGKYKLILNGVKSYIDALFCLFEKVWESENKPSSWE